METRVRKDLGMFKKLWKEVGRLDHRKGKRMWPQWDSSVGGARQFQTFWATMTSLHFIQNAGGHYMPLIWLTQSPTALTWGPQCCLHSLFSRDTAPTTVYCCRLLKSLYVLTGVSSRWGQDGTLSLLVPIVSLSTFLICRHLKSKHLVICTNSIKRHFPASFLSLHSLSY